MRTSGAREMIGMTERTEPSPIYIDTNPFIYAIEGEEAVARDLKNLFSLLRDRRRGAVTSELTLAEVLAKTPSPLHRRQYLDLLIWSGIVDLQPITREILIETAAYRREVPPVNLQQRSSMPKLPDAIHVVTAIRSGCNQILSADGRLKLPDGLQLIPADRAGITQLIREVS